MLVKKIEIDSNWWRQCCAFQFLVSFVVVNFKTDSVFDFGPLKTSSFWCWQQKWPLGEIKKSKTEIVLWTESFKTRQIFNQTNYKTSDLELYMFLEIRFRWKTSNWYIEICTKLFWKSDKFCEFCVFVKPDSQSKKFSPVELKIKGFKT